MKKIVIIFFISLILSCDMNLTYNLADWTIMFYLADDHTQTLNLNNDFLELVKKEVNTSNIRISILYDGPKNGDSSLKLLDSPFINNYRVIPLANTDLETVNNNNELDMSNENTLTNYIKLVKSRAPAKNYALFFGSHGTGYVSNFPGGLAVEDDIDTDSGVLTTIEIAKAVNLNNGIDLITFDACYLGNIETVYEFKGIADYIIASPEVIPGPGNDYEGFIKSAYSINDLTPLLLGTSTLEVYFKAYQLPTNSLQQLYDVNKIAQIVESDYFKNELLYFKYNKNSSTTTFNSDDYSDIYDISNLDSNLDTAIIKPINGIYKWISIYLPDRKYYNPLYEKTKFAQLYPEWVNIITN